MAFLRRIRYLAVVAIAAASAAVALRFSVDRTAYEPARLASIGRAAQAPTLGRLMRSAPPPRGTELRYDFALRHDARVFEGRGRMAWGGGVEMSGALVLQS